MCLHYYAIKKNSPFLAVVQFKNKKGSPVDNNYISQDTTSSLYAPYTYLYFKSHFNESFMSFLANMSNIQEPTSYTNAKNDINWISAMQHSLMLLKQITTLPASK